MKLKLTILLSCLSSLVFAQAPSINSFTVGSDSLVQFTKGENHYLARKQNASNQFLEVYDLYFNQQCIIPIESNLNVRDFTSTSSGEILIAHTTSEIAPSGYCNFKAVLRKYALNGNLIDTVIVNQNSFDWCNLTFFVESIGNKISTNFHSEQGMDDIWAFKVYDSNLNFISGSEISIPQFETQFQNKKGKISTCGRGGEDNAHMFVMKSDSLGVFNYESIFDEIDYSLKNNLVFCENGASHFLIYNDVIPTLGMKVSVMKFDQNLAPISDNILPNFNSNDIPKQVYSGLNYLTLFSIDNLSETFNLHRYDSNLSLIDSVQISSNTDFELVNVVQQNDSVFLVAGNDLTIKSGNSMTLKRIVFGIDNLSISTNEQIDFEVFPNPVDDILYLKNCKNVQYQLLNSQGMLVDEGFATESIDFINVQNGVYFLRIPYNNSFLIQKIIKG